MTRRTSLTKFAGAMRDPDPAKALEATRAAYEASGGEVVLINKSWLPGWSDQALLDGLAKKALKVKRGK
ncbi:hypothetical protein GRI97_08165 [Altererythrobacter xixiisoli]|uniref:Uncharacterized protein n=1 Tax=Croceibacterium xixiisoli TaxID=1476466 RepID=A0A6I4TUT2_9SPHN|nr:hypothetical protein [Croceibacterium xixiisoli]MXO98961.1 hypothetical protein [Croceibacterium xixiisoli]